MVPNALTPSPVTAGNHTKNVIQTGGRNRIELEDAEGKQWIDIRTPPKDTELHLGEPHDGHSHYIVAKTKGNCLFEIGSDQDISVGGRLTETVKGVVTEKYLANQKTTIGQGRDETIAAGGLTQHVTGGWQQTIKGGGKQAVTGNYEHVVSAVVKEHYGAQHLKVDGDVVQNCGQCRFRYADLMVTTDGPMVFDAPSITMNAPSITMNTPDWKVEGGKWYEQVSLKGESTDLHLEWNGVHVDLCGMKFENRGVNVAALAVAMWNHGTKVEKAGADAEQKGINSILAGLFSVT